VRLLVLSEMFPSEMHPSSAIFLANFLLKLNRYLDDLLVISPRVYIPRVLSFRERWARHRNVTAHGSWQGIEVMRPPFLYVPGDLFLPFAGASMETSILPTVKKIVKTRRFDAILGFNAIPDGDAAVRLSKRLNIPSIVWCIGTDINGLPAKSRSVWHSAEKLLEGASLVVTSSISLADRAKSICSTLTNVKPFYRGIDLDTFRSLPLRSESRQFLGIPENARVLIHIGRLMPEKGIFELLSVLPRFSDESSPVYLLLVGEDLMGAEIDELLSLLPHPERVVRTGVVSHKDVAFYLSSADVLVLGSYQEGLPNALVEAMAAGVPVVATDVGGIPEVVNHEENGLLIPPKDSDALYAAVSRMFEDQNLRTHCIQNGRTLAWNRFDAERNAGVFVTILNETVADWKKNRNSGRSTLSFQCS
jgi:glycosyltransferase involved in cell wall biosynthesis